jgi:hypothetical protein
MFYVSLFFSFVNDNEKMTINALQIMHWILCYFNIVFSFHPIFF